jgi:hypothetical protein
MAAKGGKRPGAGRKSKAEEMGLAALLDGCVTDADRKALFRALLRKGKAGDVKAAGLLLGYIYGTPRQTVAHENPDGTPLELTVRIVRGKK